MSFLPSHSIDPHTVLQPAFEAALGLFSMLAGRLRICDGHVVVGAAAMPVVLAESGLSAADVDTDCPYSALLDRLAPPGDGDDAGTPVLALQATRFACGGGICSWHLDSRRKGSFSSRPDTGGSGEEAAAWRRAPCAPRVSTPLARPRLRPFAAAAEPPCGGAGARGRRARRAVRAEGAGGRAQAGGARGRGAEDGADRARAHGRRAQGCGEVCQEYAWKHPRSTAQDLVYRCGEVYQEYAKTFYLATQLMTPERRRASPILWRQNW